jgi:hypothetical protein
VAFWSSFYGVVIVAGTKQTDDRLLASEYYRAREADWFGCGHGHRKPLAPAESPIELTEAEREYLEFVLREFGDAVRRHGWYDVAGLLG